MSSKRGDVVVATDPFNEEKTAGRPFLIVNRKEIPFHGEQYIGLALTTRTWYDERIPLTDEHWSTGGAPHSSAIMPWSVNSIKHDWIDYRQGTLEVAIVDQAVTDLIRYIH